MPRSGIPGMSSANRKLRHDQSGTGCGCGLRWVMRLPIFLPVAFILVAVTGCGYHTLGAATHLPPGVHTLSVPVFATRTEVYHTETVMTDAVIREFATRTRFRVTPSENPDADAVLHGTILKEYTRRSPTTPPRSSPPASSSPWSFPSRSRQRRQSPLREHELRLPPAVPGHHRPAAFIQENPAAVERPQPRLRARAGGRCAGRLLSFSWRIMKSR